MAVPPLTPRREILYANPVTKIKPNPNSDSNTNPNPNSTNATHHTKPY